MSWATLCNLLETFNFSFYCIFVLPFLCVLGGGACKMNYFSLAFPKAKHEKRIWLPVIYLGDDLRKHWEESREVRRKSSKWIQAVIKNEQLTSMGHWALISHSSKVSYPLTHPGLWGSGIYAISMPRWLKATPRAVSYPVLPDRWRVSGACSRMTLLGTWWVSREGTLR